MLLEKYLDEYRPTDGLLGLKPRGVAQVLVGLEAITGIKCNAHSFRRTFATESVRSGAHSLAVDRVEATDCVAKDKEPFRKIGKPLIVE